MNALAVKWMETKEYERSAGQGDNLWQVLGTC